MVSSALKLIGNDYNYLDYSVSVKRKKTVNT